MIYVNLVLCVLLPFLSPIFYREADKFAGYMLFIAGVANAFAVFLELYTQTGV